FMKLDTKLPLWLATPMPPRGGYGATIWAHSRAVSAGNAAALGVADLVEWYGVDPETKVSLAYVEGISNGRDLMDRLGAVARTKPVVVVKGGATENGARAAASHTGALAANDAVFDGECKAHGIVRAPARASALRS
ncbi:MAG: hypothetical protein EBV77_13175, partial [Gemmatimonadaceae bacterium]|nr:hypothetical protein [Gemmatimonadaceae bacterium]